MALTYRALALLLTYPSADIQTAAPAIMAAIRSEGLVPPPIVSALDKLARKLEHEDLYELQEGFVHLFDRTRSLSLNLYEHIHGESRDRGQAKSNSRAGFSKFDGDIDRKLANRDRAKIP